MRTDDGIRERLGKLPQTLAELYKEIYEQFSQYEAEADRHITNNALAWLLCAQETLKSEEFIAAISVGPVKGFDGVSREHVLQLCCNFITYDAALNVFRFAHLSVREFLEKQPEYSTSATNSLAAEVCLLRSIAASRTLTTKKFLREHGFSQRIGQSQDSLLRYSGLYWAVHCQIAGQRRACGALQTLFDFFMQNSDSEMPFSVWIHHVKKYFYADEVDYEIRRKLWDSMEKPLFVACAFDFFEIVERHLSEGSSSIDTLSRYGLSALQVAAIHGSCQAISVFLADAGTDISEAVLKAAARNRKSGKDVMTLLLKGLSDEIKITEEVTQAAAGNEDCGKDVVALLLEQRGDEVKITEEVTKAAAEYGGREVMALLLEQRGDEVKITEEVTKAAAGNRYYGKEVMALLLEQRGDEVKITEEVTKAAVGNWGREVMALLLEQRGDEVKITEEVTKAAAGNRSCGKEVMALLLEQRGDEVKITEEVTKAAAGNWGREVMALLLEQRGDEVKITEEVTKAAAGNGGREVMALLLGRRNDEVKITEEVTKAAAGNRYCGKEVMALLLEQRGDEVKITEEVTKAAAGNKSSGKKVMKLLLERCNPVEMTEEVVSAVASMFDEEMVTLLLEKRGNHVNITEDV